LPERERLLISIEFWLADWVVLNLVVELLPAKAPEVIITAAHIKIIDFIILVLIKVD